MHVPSGKNRYRPCANTSAIMRPTNAGGLDIHPSQRMVEGSDRGLTIMYCFISCSRPQRHRMHPSQQTRRYANYESSNNMKPTEEAIEEKNRR
jgi:hypothetical protein